jgi:hypothetical protein
MARKKDTPCSRCGKLLWSGSNSAPSDKRLCRECIAGDKAPADVPGPEPDPQPDLPAWIPPEHGLGERGRRLYREFTAEGPKLGPAERVLLEEACRIADRCDQLDDFLRGREDAWMRFHARNEDGSIVEVVVDKALSEARQQASTLKALLVELRASRAGKKDEPKPEATRRDELAKRREERRRAAGL